MNFKASSGLAAKLFPTTPAAQLAAHLPDILAASDGAGGDRLLLIMAFATIRAEVGNLNPIPEMPSRFNTSIGGHPFDLYDRRRDLGNQGPPDGERFRGRGYIQLTGRANYAHYGPLASLSLISQPDLANESPAAAKLLFLFLKEKEIPIRQALAAGDLAHARRLVNGGSHGLETFATTYHLGVSLFPE